MPSFATTVTQENLLTNFTASWIRVVWYQPGATISFSDSGFQYPVSRRTYHFDRERPVTLSGRVAVEYGSRLAQGGADLERKGPRFAFSGIINVASPRNFIFAGKRTLRLDKVELVQWGQATYPALANGQALIVEVVSFSGAAGGQAPIPQGFFDPDARLSTPPGVVAISATVSTSNPGGAGAADVVGSIIVPPDAAIVIPPPLDYGPDGPVIYPKRQIASATQQQTFEFFANSALAGTDFVSFRAYFHEELF